MLTGFQRTPDGIIFVRNAGAIYADTQANFEADFGKSLAALPDGALQQLYEPGKRHFFADAEGVIGGGDMPWTLGDEIVAATDALLAAKAARVAANAPPPPAPSIPTVSRRQLLIQLKTAGLISAEEAVAAAQTGTVPAAVQAVFDTLPTQSDRDDAAITWAAMSMAERDNPLVSALAAANGMNAAAIDEFFLTAAAL